MYFRLLLSALVVTVLAGCPFSDSKSKKEKATAREEAERKKKDTTSDQNNDVTFQSFVGQLRLAVANRDQGMLASMMAPGFGYRWDHPPEGENMFMYWDQNNLWPELSLLMAEGWTPFESYMIAPAKTPLSPDYRGYRAGVKQFQGSWRFAYFVPPPPTPVGAPAE